MAVCWYFSLLMVGFLRVYSIILPYLKYFGEKNYRCSSKSNSNLVVLFLVFNSFKCSTPVPFFAVNVSKKGTFCVTKSKPNVMSIDLLYSTFSWCSYLVFSESQKSEVIVVQGGAAYDKIRQTGFVKIHFETGIADRCRQQVCEAKMGAGEPHLQNTSREKYSCCFTLNRAGSRKRISLK